MSNEWIQALIGGALIGLAASWLLYWNGRVAGISGILYGLVRPVRGEIDWRIFFFIGILLGGIFGDLWRPNSFATSLELSPLILGVAGIAVGFGTAMGGGCTSGHGVCGISRLSIRSIVATLVFILAGILAVFVFKKCGVLP